MKAKEKNDELLAEVATAKQSVRPDGLAADSLSQIQRRAYQLWQERGGIGGRELDDWLQAEAEIKAALGPPEKGQPAPAKQQTKQQTRQPRYNKHATAD
ncbi:MAG: DUF2934 domain-containing protein [Acidobacteria bacterium]|nr:DUF2934 domain-containing protein [Acidobacteriota bacterium]